MSPFSKNNVALIAVCLASLMFGLEISSVPVILPTLEKILHGDFKDMQWIMNAYTIACATVLMATGTLADRFGRKRVFLVSIVAFGATSLMCGLSPTAPLLIASRFLQGLAGGAMFICVIAILSHQFPDAKERGRAFALWGVISGVGLGFGPIIGGLIVAISSWTWVFLVYVPLSGLSFALAVVAIEESRDPHAKKLDIWGLVALSLAVFGLAFYITQGAELGFTGLPGLGVLAATILSFIAFVAIERWVARPMFDFSVFKIRNFSGAIIGCVGMNFSFWPFMIYLPIYFQGALGYDSTAAGLALLAYTVPFLVMPPIAERLLMRYEARIIIPLGMFIIGLGFHLMTAGAGLAQASWLTMFPGALIAGVGLGLTTTPATNTTTASVPSNRAGMASGIDVSARLISLAINIAVMGVVLVEGVRWSLKTAFPVVEPARLRALAETVAAGNLAPPADLASHASNGALRSALVNGIQWVTLYGGLGAWALAAISFAIFAARPASCVVGKASQ